MSGQWARSNAPDPERRSLIVRIIWAVCLVLAGFNHARILLAHGLFWAYHGAHPASAVYWTSLTFIDPLVAAFLLIRPRAGVIATVLLITTNVVHNLAVTIAASPDGRHASDLLISPQIMSQIGFLLFVLVTWPLATRSSNSAP